MIARGRHSASEIAAASALLLWSMWSTSLLLGLCCPIAPTPPCHGGQAPDHCLTAALEQGSFGVSISLPDSSFAFALPLGHGQLAPSTHWTGEGIVSRGIRLQLLIGVLRI